MNQQVLLEPLQRMFGNYHVHRPLCDDHHCLRGRPLAGQSGDEIDSRGIHPLQILEHPQQGRFQVERVQHLPDLAQHAFPGRPENLLLQHLALFAVQQRRELHQPGGRLRGQNLHHSFSPCTMAQLTHCFQHRVIGFRASVPFHALSAGDAEGWFLGRGLALEFVHQSRLSNSRLPRDEDDLALALQCLSEAGSQRTKLAVSAHQSAAIQARRRPGSSRLALLHRGHKPIPAPGQGLDKKRIPGAVPQRAPDVGDLVLQDLRLDEGIGPHRLQELILGHQAASVLHKITQDGERFGSQHDALVASGIPAAP